MVANLFDHIAFLENKIEKIRDLVEIDIDKVPKRKAEEDVVKPKEQQEE